MGCPLLGQGMNLTFNPKGSTVSHEGGYGTMQMHKHAARTRPKLLRFSNRVRWLLQSVSRCGRERRCTSECVLAGRRRDWIRSLMSSAGPREPEKRGRVLA